MKYSLIALLITAGVPCSYATSANSIKADAAKADTILQQPDLIKVSEADEPMEKGPFKPTWESLVDYNVPEWFRDAKFGMWAHWGAQCVEGSGDWMARELYMEDNWKYKHHLEHYGHPSEFGYKDLLPLFTAENWQPDSIVALYKDTGAKYFFVLGNHHDNYDLWDSKYQEWNSQNIGPHTDILARWEKACRDNDLKFGVSLHADHAWIWYEPARRYDRNGPKARIPYDGNLTVEDGKGKWWEGYDPQKLYVQNHPASDFTWSDGAIHNQWGWLNGAARPSEEFVTNFYNRTLDVINRYNPDLIYFDVTGVPFHPISDAGVKILTHFYNHKANQNSDGVIFGKILTDVQKEALVWDVERGAPNYIVDRPWQTCTCIGDWHYNNGFYNDNRYKSASSVVRLLADVVSKNGNLLLNIPLRGDGTYDDKAEKIIREIGVWMRRNGDAIYGTRPWVKFGEGPIADSNIAINAQGFNEGAYVNAGADEIRFTTKGKDLYAIALAWPDDNNIKIASLAKGNANRKGNVRSVELLGYGKVPFKVNSEALHITLPEDAPKTLAPAFLIR